MLDINPFIQTAFGAIVGGMVVIATNWLNTAREKRKEVQEWYEQRYVTEGIDPLLVYFSNIAFQLVKTPDDKTLILPEATIPIEALTRIEVLLGINGGMEYLGVFIGHLNTNLVSADEYQNMSILPLFGVCELLYQLRQEVLRLIPRKISRKNQQLELNEHRDNIMMLILEFGDEIKMLRLKKQEAAPPRKPSSPANDNQK